MSETSASLLDRLQASPDEDAWRRLVEIYTPLVRGCLHRNAQLQPGDVDDLVQEVLAVVVRRVPEFRRERTGSFRAWLRQITVNCLRDYWKARRAKPVASGGSEFLHMLDQLEDPGSGLSKLWDEEHDRHVTKHLLELIRPGFEPRTWRAFERVVLEGGSPDDVARELGVTANVVYIARSRVLTRLREVGKGLID
jgi:RNA polymerase sigma-70 factor (ECF subfamily)